MDPVGSLSAWIAVDDVNLDNACMHFVPGSHKFGRLDPVPLDHEVDDPLAMEMEAGGITFHYGCNFHCAWANRTAEPRRAFAIIYIPDYVMFAGDKDAAGAADEMEAGGPQDHPVYPVLA